MPHKHQSIKYSKQSQAIGAFERKPHFLDGRGGRKSSDSLDGGAQAGGDGPGDVGRRAAGVDAATKNPWRCRGAEEEAEEIAEIAD